ncbi:MAG TPA: DUF433 domain-containing protein [Anaerolineae bacterium]|nr:DUF433 domain-containing protein [Anaerolineae bacterium]HMR65798.1 DUF433 domain-containing protein [Anaerolineae bacterium]
MLKTVGRLEKFPELEWREGPGGRRVGLRGTAIDVYTVVGFSKAGYDVQEIGQELLPQLATTQVQAALNYYAQYPDSIDTILADSQPQAAKAQLFRKLGPEAYEKLMGHKAEPAVIREARTSYNPDEPA